MKKILLSILCLVAVALTGYAAEVTFDFTNPTGLNPSITPAAAQNGVNVSDQTFTNGDITFTATQGTTTDARIWSNNNGTYEMRLYKGATITIKSATDPITKITFTGSTLGSTTTADGTTAAEEWTGSANEVVYTIADNSGTVKISSIVVSTDKVLDCELTWNENSPFIQASTMMPKTNFVSPLGNTGANYWVTYDGSEPSADNPSASKKYPSNTFSMYLVKKDTIFTMKVRAEKDGAYGKTLEGTFYFTYTGALTAYKGINTMAAGNYVMSVDGAVARRIDENAKYGELPTVAATAANGGASAFSYFEWTFEATEGGYYIKDSYGRYLYMSGTYNNFNVTTSTPTAGGVWTVELQADGTAKIMNVDKQKYIQCYETGGVKTFGSFDYEKGAMPVLGAVFTPVVTMTPESGATLESISKITFTCPDGIKAGSKYSYCSVQGTSSTSAVKSTNQVDDNTVEFILESEVTSSGEYNFILYKEALVVAPNSVAQVYPAKTEYHTYTVKSSAPEIQLVVTPENESTQKSLQHFTFSYETGIYVNNLFGGQAPFLGFTDPTTGNSSQIALTATTATETSVTLSTDKEQTAEGYYTLVVPAEYFVLADSKPNEAIMNQYIVSATNPNAVNILSVTPEEGTVTELSKITVITDSDLEAAPSNWTITDAKGNSYAFKVTNNDNDDNNTYEALNIVLNETITAEGTYTLNIPAGSVKEYLGSKTIEAHTITWTIGGTTTEPTNIEFLSVKPEEGTVTSLKEIQIISDSDLGEANNLKLTDANGTEYAISSVTNDREGEDGIYESVIVTIQDEITAEGTYTLTIPAGSVVEYITDMNITPKVNAEKTYTWTIGGTTTEPDYIFNANDYEVDAEYTTLTDGIFTFLQGDGSTKPWIFDANDKKFSNGHEATLRIKPQTDKNYLTADVPAAGKLVFGVLSSSSSATDRLLSVKQNDVELYGKVVSEADKVDGVYNVHEVNVEAGLATITMAGSLNFYYIEFVPGQGGEDVKDGLYVTATDPENNATVNELKEILVSWSMDYIDEAGISYDKPYVIDAEGTTVSTTKISWSNVAGNQSRHKLTTPITTNGTYTFVIPADYMAGGDMLDKYNKEERFTFVVEAAAAPVVTATWNIEEGAVIESFKEVTVTFAGEGIEAAKPWNTYGCTWFYAKDADGNYALVENQCSEAGYFDAAVSGTSVTLSLSEVCYTVPFTTKGEYRIVIPVGGIYFNGDRENKSTEEYVLNFTIENDIVPPTEVNAAFTADPENNATLAELKQVTLTFTEYEAVTVVEPDMMSGSNIPAVYMYDDLTGSTMPTGMYMFTRAGANANQVELYFDPNYGLESINIDGSYMIRIPTGAIKFGNDINAPIELNYTVKAGEVVVEKLEVTASDPAVGSTIRNKWEEVIVTWNKNIDMTYDGQCYVLDAEGNKVSDADGSYVYDENHVCVDNQLKFIIKTPIEEAEGEYTLVIVAGYVYDMADNTNVNEEIRLTYHVSNSTAINSIKVDAVNGYVVYNLNGHRVMQTKKAADLYRLENGLYIINGQKVILNK